jgi:DNA-binding PadR family transcriptional regulator
MSEADKYKTACADGQLPLIQWVVLTLVIRRPSHGYEISDRYERKCSVFLPASRASIYSALKRLERRKLIESVDSLSLKVRGGTRRGFRATSAGAGAHKDWLNGDMPTTDAAEMLARVAAAGVLGPAVIRLVLLRYRVVCVSEMKEIETLAGGNDQRSIDALAARIIASQRLSALHAALQWIDGSAQDIISSHETACDDDEKWEPYSNRSSIH